MHTAIRTLVGAALLLALAVGGTPRQADAKDEIRAPSLAKSGRSIADDNYRTVMFAVLEGLYEAGVENDVVDRVLMPDPETNEAMHFVPGCPICQPALTAFRMYRERPSLGLKGGDTFGPGVHEDIRARLESEVFEDRMRGVWDIIEASIRKRIERMRLTPEERAEWEQSMAERRKKGMAMLKRSAGAIAQSDRCAACDAANDAFDAR